MADTFLLRLTGDTAVWAAFDATGRLASPIGRGSLHAARGAVAGRRVTVLVPAVDVISTSAVLPAAGAARLRQIVPFSLEEMLADDVEQMFFAIGTRLPSGATPVAVAARQRVDAWLAALHAAGMVPQALFSEADGVPEVPATLVLLVEGERVYGRLPGQVPFAFEGLTLRQVIDVAGGATDAEPPRHLLVYVDDQGRARFRDELAALGETFASVDVKVAADGIFPHLAATLAQRAGTNLLQGAYAPRSNWAALGRPWRFAAALVIVSAALGFVARGAEYWQLRRADGALTELVAAGCERTVGDARPSACQREVQQRLGSESTSGSETFLSTLAAVAETRDPSARIDALSYRNRTMNLQMIATSVPALDEFARGLEQTSRFDVEIEAANQVDNGTEGRIRIVGVSP